METIIKVNPSELNMSLIDKIKSFIGSKENIDVTISLREFDTMFQEELDISLEQSKNPKEIISMTMEEFIAYAPNKL
ncbi:MAG: hypothetical protein NTZ19_09295 [Bacteroidetes bacterium]|nr:hypothetical protein [Bacteroidota bacterium]